MKIDIHQPPVKSSKNDIIDSQVSVPLLPTPGEEGVRQNPSLVFQDTDNVHREKLLFKVSMVIGVLLGGLALCNVGLMWSVKSVLRQSNQEQEQHDPSFLQSAAKSRGPRSKSRKQVDAVGVRKGRLTDSTTGEEVSVLGHGHAVEATPNTEYITRYLHLMKKHVWADRGIGSDFHAELSTLNEDEPIAFLEIDSSEANSIFQGYQEGQTVTVSVSVAGIVYTGRVAPGATYSSNGQKASRSVFAASSDQECQVYDKIVDEGQISTIFQVSCCDNANCTVKVNDPGFNGVFDKVECAYPEDSEYDCDGIDDCFSPYSIVVEKNKGVLYMKDLIPGDQVKAAGGIYREVLFSGHSHPSKTTSFLQIHTESSESPLEVTSNHLVFIYGEKLPVPAGDVNVGDLMEGFEGPVKVTRIENVVRDGLYSFVTSDATLFVNGVLASSMSTLDPAGKAVSFDFGLFKVHVHTLAARIFAPFMKFGCSKIDPFYCSQVDDGSGGTMHVFVAVGQNILKKHPVVRVFVVSYWIIVGMIGILCYYLSYLIVPTASIYFMNALMSENRSQCS